MRKKQKNIMTYIAIFGMIASMFPVFGVWAEEENQGRDAHILVNDITLMHLPEDVVDGIYRTGNFRLNVSFQLTDAVRFVNVTLNVTYVNNATMTEENTTHLGNLSAGNYFSLDLHPFSFSTEGEYRINATVRGNYSGSNISTSLVEQIRFSNQARYELNFEVTEGAQAETGEYANDTVLTITGNVTNKGNYDIHSTNITINITGPEGFEEFDQPWSNPFGMLMVNKTIDDVEFHWLPSMEGDFDINVTATDVITNQSSSTNFTIRIQDVADIHIGVIQPEESVKVGKEFEVTVFLNNTGNAENDVNVTLTILNANLVSVYTGWIWGEISPIDLKTPIKFLGIIISTKGTYTIRASIEGSQNECELIVSPLDPTQPVLEGEIMVPNPYEEDVHAGEIITFYVNYSDVNNDSGNVTLILDDTEYEMVLSDGVGDSWVSGETFKYEWKAIEGTTHNFYFNFTDGLFTDLPYRPLYDDFTVLPPIKGMLYGKVTHDDENVPYAKINIYQQELNVTGAPTGNHTNITYVETDENGSYMKELSFSDYKYILEVDGDWMAANDYKGADPAITNFWVNSINLVIWKNFTLESTIPEPPETWLNGTVNDTEGNPLYEVTITVEIFTDEPPGKMLVQKELNGTMQNVSVDITNRTWTNMTATTDANGTYSIIGVPFGVPEALNDTGTKTFRHDLGDIPRKVDEGWWYVNASEDEYVSQEKMLKFVEGETTVWNFTLERPPDGKQKATISGIIIPADAKITIVPTATIKHDNTTGVYSIVDLEDGNYTLTFNATGYIDRTVNASIVDGKDYIVGEITLPDWRGDGVMDEVTIGPFMDGDDAVSGITITFSLEKDYDGVTGSDGNVTILLYEPRENLKGIEITATKGDVTKKWKWIIDEAPYDAFKAGEEGKDDGEKKSSIGGIILIILGIVAIIIVVVVILMMRSKTKEEELFEEEMREYECPGCGAIVNAGMDACPECGEVFEVEEFRCPECSELVEKDATICDSCGAEFEMPEQAEEGEEEEEEGEEEVEGEPEAIEDFDVEEEGEEDEELEGVEEAAEELEETPPPLEEEGLEDLDLDDDLEDLEDDLDIEDL